MDFPLSKREWILYEELKNKFREEKTQDFDSISFHKYEEWLFLLVKKGVLWHIKVDGAYLYSVEGSFDDFEQWIKDLDKKERKMNNREWKIAIVSAIMGAIIGLIPTFVSLL